MLVDLAKMILLFADPCDWRKVQSYLAESQIINIIDKMSFLSIIRMMKSIYGVPT